LEITLRSFANSPGAVTFSPDSLTVALLAGDAFLWSVKGGEALIDPLRHRDVVTSISFHPDGHIVLTGSTDGTARLWDLHTGLPLSELLSHGGPVNRVRFSPDRNRFLTASDDGSARIWDLPFGVGVAPSWLAPVAEGIGGLRLDSQRRSVAVGWNEREKALQSAVVLPSTNQLIKVVQSLIHRSLASD
jgi:WD40 repeat protein